MTARVSGARVETLSLQEARRAALRAQGFGRARRRGRIDGESLLEEIGRPGLLQIDSVNVLARAHYLPLFSRIGSYPLSLLEDLAWGPEPALFEYWAHEASLLPLKTHPLFRWRMERALQGREIWTRMAPFAGPRRREAEAVLERIEKEGPKAASELAERKGSGGWWGWSDVKTALEWLFWSGLITTKSRRGSFERVYDLAERVIPEAIRSLPTPSADEAQRRLVMGAATRLGVATGGDLRDYHRLSAEDGRARVAELCETGALRPLAVEGSSLLWYAPENLASGAAVEGAALLAPFDPLIWTRGRTERLFGVRYRLEIYTPAERREHGYYVLPFLLDEAIVARVDLKAERSTKRLLVRRASQEAGAPRRAGRALAGELRRLARWLGLETVVLEGPAFRTLETALEAAPD